MRALFFLADFVAFSIIVMFSTWLRYGSLTWKNFWFNAEVLLPVFFLTSLVLWVFSFYDLKALKKHRISYRSLISAFAVAFMVSSLGIYFIAPLLNLATPKVILISMFLMYFVYMDYTRRIYAGVGGLKTNALILGKSNTLKEIKVSRVFAEGYNIVGEFEDPALAAGLKAEDIDIILISSRLFSQNKAAWQIIADNFLNKGVLLNTDFNLYEELFMRAPKEGFKDAMWLLRGVAARQDSKIYPVVKRSLDICFCLVLIPFFLPVMAFTYVLIRVVDGFEPLFTQERIGKLEHKIYIYKFRTMKPDTESITKLGAILRRFRLDEVPQLINILHGDISIVGPRPVWTDEYYFLNKHVSGHALRSIIKPGLTGWAQLNFKAPPTYCVQDEFKNKEVIPDASLDAAYKRLSYDIWYIKNRSLLMDIEIILKTAKRAFIKDKYVS